MDILTELRRIYEDRPDAIEQRAADEIAALRDVLQTVLDFGHNYPVNHRHQEEFAKAIAKGRELLNADAQREAAIAKATGEGK